MIVGVSMVRNEADVIEATVRHLLCEGLDWLLIADNLSTDGTDEILHGLAQSLLVEVVCDPDPAYYQAEKMTRLARRAIAEGAEWVVPFDADEVWYAPGTTIAHALKDCTADVVTAYGWDHLARHDDPAGHPFRTICYRRPERQPFPKVAFRAHDEFEIAQGNHHVTRPGPRALDVLQYRHFQYRTFAQFKAKVRHGKHAYDLTDLDYSQGEHWRRQGAMTDGELGDEWRALCSTSGLVYDPAPLRCP